MKQFLKRNKKYLIFAYCYLVLLSLVGLSMTFSRYRSGDGSGDSAAAAKYEIIIYSGDSIENRTRIDVPVYATSKITDTASMYEGTYGVDKVTVINRSECTVRLSDAAFSNDPDTAYYSKLLYLSEDNTQPEIGDVKTYLGVSDNAAVADVNNAVDNKNTGLDAVIPSGGSATMYVVTWVEHDNVYNTNNLHQTIQEIGVRPEHFTLTIKSEQAD